jgi:hypothetical protein
LCRLLTAEGERVRAVRSVAAAERSLVVGTTIETLARSYEDVLEAARHRRSMARAFS